MQGTQRAAWAHGGAPVNQSVQGVDRMSRVDTTCIPRPSAVTLTHANHLARWTLHCEVRYVRVGDTCLIEPGGQLWALRTHMDAVQKARPAGAPAR